MQEYLQVVDGSTRIKVGEAGTADLASASSRVVLLSMSSRGVHWGRCYLKSEYMLHYLSKKQLPKCQIILGPQVQPLNNRKNSSTGLLPGLTTT